MKGVKSLSALLLALSVLTTASVALAGFQDEVVQAPRAQDIQAPRSHGAQDVQAPRSHGSQDVQAPRSHGSQDIQSPRGLEAR
jgi:hypothetical protein